jgi:hypothetical protein
LPDTPVEIVGSWPYPSGMETRVAVLEQLARTTTSSLERLERRMDLVVADQRSDFRWMVGIMLGGFSVMLGGFGAMLGVMAHGFHWL